ncbi:MBL fold metallo-hydrolase [Methanoculleus taiwanensis]|nr:MBL fold metallo-hydrolase [Methanoculleus taiwanensis]
MPDKTGALHKAAEIVKQYGGNINRVHYDRRIDAATVFFEVTTTEDIYRLMRDDLHAIGYLQESLQTPGVLTFYVYLPHRSGALYDFLEYITESRANIAYIDFDDRGKHPDRLKVSLNVEETGVVDHLLNQLKSRYRLEIIEYDTTGKHLDDTVFYVKFAQELRELIGEAEDEFLLQLLHDINHIAQELQNRGTDPREVFRTILLTGRTLQSTCGEGFYADLQRIPVTGDIDLFCFQLPCGGNVYLLRTPGEAVMIDTGYGIYHREIAAMFRHYGLCDNEAPGRVLITHADADHCGGGGYLQVPSLLHPGSVGVIREANRAYGSRSESSILEEVYTTVINLFSEFRPPENLALFPTESQEKRSIFPIIDRIAIGDLELEVLESLGGHLHGLFYLYCPDHGLLFTSDTLINFASLDERRSSYNALADFLVTSVNVDSDRARMERKALLELIASRNASCSPSERPCLVCCGHGAVSVLDGTRLATYGEVEQYRARGETRMPPAP